MSRVQLALNVGDLDASIDFYTKLFKTPPAKVRENYANFAIAEPPLKLVLIAGHGEPGSLNHVGVEVESTDEVAAAAARMQAEGARMRRAGVDHLLLRRAGQGLGRPVPRSRGRSTPSSPTPTCCMATTACRPVRSSDLVSSVAAGGTTCC